MNYDITFCSYKDCPLTDCERHLINVKQPYPKGYISISDFSGICRDYIGYLVDEIEKEKNT